MDAIKEPALEKRRAGKEIILLSAYTLSEKKLGPSARGRIEPGASYSSGFVGEKSGQES